MKKVFGVVGVFLLISMACFTAGCITPDNSENVETNNGVESVEMGYKISSPHILPNKKLTYSGWIDRSGEKTILFIDNPGNDWRGTMLLEAKINDTINYCGTKFVIIGLDGDKLTFKYI